MRNATVKDVAKRAGVSAMTVSRVLNGTGHVSDTTREKVRQAAQELQYFGNSVARSLRMNSTHTLGVVLSDSSEMVTSKVLRGIQDEAAEHGYTLITANTDRHAGAEQRAIETLLSKQIDGIILVAPLLYSSGEIQWLKKLSMPFVMLMRSSEDGTVDTVMNDNLHGGYLQVQHLISRGCRRFFFLTIEDSLSARIRMDGARKALLDNGIGQDAVQVVEIKHDLASGYEKTKEYLDRLRGCDALVCGCDTIAIGAMRALHEAGVAIPDEIRVMGYDGIDIGNYLAVPLSTVAQPFYEIGTEGARMLLMRLNDPEQPAVHRVFEGTLEIRSST